MAWRDFVSRKGFAAWLRVQPLTAGKHVLVNGVVVFVDEKFSVTCEIGIEGVRWWLTRESGQLPPRCGDQDYWSCCGRESDDEVVEPVAYLVVKMFCLGCLGSSLDYLVCFALLSRGTFNDWVKQLLEGVVTCVESRVHYGRACNVPWYGACDVEVYWRLEYGVRDGRGSWSDWRWQEGFTGVRPCGENVSWWSGVTDAVGDCYFMVMEEHVRLCVVEVFRLHVREVYRTGVNPVTDMWLSIESEAQASYI
ncbi:hypothetical protein K469DRAFT_684429 [Zopfia rhizophila CBS 207.26]|uniref:Uncharacterized protein n=1 Tax=Zopfia rhizophila CBS 207.26 TaxID=1314779 RepID=A0A6A6D7Z1_9PEZI|nr:hypothetical protein K469DRAFT_684429 [Zopfia rhizophila CBS 207.26]